MASDGKVTPAGSGGLQVAAGLAVFEKYDRPPLLTDERRIATFEGGAEVAYPEDQDGNKLSLAQVGDRNPTKEDR